MDETSLRAIVIYPRLANIGEIERIRKRYDPLFGQIRPHITLVFPFRREISKGELRSRVEGSLEGCRPFRLVLRGITGHEGEYLFLNVIQGNDAIIDIHRRLYSGALATHCDRSYAFLPHITVGRCAIREELIRALGSLQGFDALFETTVDTVSIVRLDDSNLAVIENRVIMGDI
ncbi:MAG: 2'-5' RNA ligase family protein [Candidatus Coatesbacteria bacterium]|nr:2'-5' RNA ligase family protein [Candidatus Coatesbacteria bacterium]